MFRTALVILCLLMLPAAAGAQTNLNLGDVVFTGYQSDTPDEFTVLLLVAVDSGTTLTFDENGWFAIGGFRCCEGVVTWTAGANLPKNTQVTIDPAGLTASNDAGQTAGTVTVDAGSFALSASGDQIFAYQGTAPSAGDESNFVSAIQMNGGWDGDATNTNTSAQPSVFTDGVNSLSISPEADNAIYDCSTTDGTPAALRTAITNSANWTTSSTAGLMQPPCPLTPVELQSFSVE